MTGMSFPFDFCGCCPVPIRSLFPSTWRKVQSWTHLCLLITLLVGVAIAVLDILSVYNRQCWSKKTFYCAGEISTFIFVIPLTTYIIRLIGQHDDRMITVQHDLREEKRQLSEAYGSLINEMNTMLNRSTDNSYGFAERSFEDKRRDFVKFLEHCEPKFAQVCAGSKADTEKFLNQFKTFLRGWLKIFEECSIDPASCPNRVVEDKEIDECRTLGETVELVVGRLKWNSVQFITSRLQEDDAKRKKYEKSRNQLEGKQSSAFDATESQLSSNQTNSARLMTNLVDQDPDPESQSGILCTWIKCGSGVGCRVCSGRSQFPRTTSCFCMQFSLLSKEHVMIIMSFINGWGVFVLRILNKDDRDCLVVLTGAYNVLLFLFLFAFERVDYLLKLERELAQLEKQKDDVDKEKVEMQDYWEKVHDKTEIWLHRTVPRLDLMKEIHGQLEDRPQHQVQALLEGVNGCMARLEDQIGDVKYWMAEGDDDAANKKQIGEKINQLVCLSGDIVLEFEKKLSSGALEYQPPPPVEKVGVMEISQNSSTAIPTNFAGSLSLKKGSK